MPTNYRFSLTFSILASLASLLLLTWLLLSIISFKTAEKDLLAAKSAHAATLLNVVIATLPDSIEQGTLSRVAEVLATEPGFAGLILTNESAEPLYRFHDEQPVDTMLLETLKRPKARCRIAPEGLQLLCYAPVIKDRQVKGAARLSLSLAGEYTSLARSRTLFLGYFILDFILLLGLGAFMLRRIVVAPLDKLLKATARIMTGDYSHPLHLPASREIAGLADSFNSMQLGLKERSEAVESHLRSLQEANSALQAARLETVRSEKMASIGLLAAGMAHEVGTPLAGIIGYSGILAEELAADPEKSDYLRRIAADAARIDRLVKDLLNYARPVKPEIERIDVTEFLEDTLEMLERQGVFKRIEVSLNLAAGLPNLYLDRHQLMQVLMNLVINARDAMPGGGEMVISAAPGENEAVIIAVKDSGEGIAAENIDKIFDPFFTTKEPGSGTGLGLAISARLVESFGGVLEVASQPGRGATFRVNLPGVKQ